MEKVKLKNCPNCNERIGIQDIECPYCKYIDDPLYQKQNKKLKGKKKKKKKENDIYKILLIVPIISYLIFLLFNFDLLKIVIFALILLNILCIFTKKVFWLYVIIIEIIALLFNFIANIYEMSLSSNYNDITKQLIILILGFILIIVPKIIYLTWTNKKKKKKK